jgi:hypothetical protein
MGCAGVESRLSSLKLAFDAVWLVVVGVGCVVSGMVVVFLLDHIIRWKGFDR